MVPLSAVFGHLTTQYKGSGNLVEGSRGLDRCEHPPFFDKGNTHSSRDIKGTHVILAFATF